MHICDMTHSYVWHDAFICVTWLMHMCDMTHAYLWHESFICVTWRIHMCDMTHSYVWQVIWRNTFMCVVRECESHDSFICATHMCVSLERHKHRPPVCKGRHITCQSCVWHESSICVTWLMHMCNILHAHERNDSFICVTWRIHMCDMTHSYVWHDSCTRATW